MTPQLFYNTQLKLAIRELFEERPNRTWKIVLSQDIYQKKISDQNHAIGCNESIIADTDCLIFEVNPLLCCEIFVAL